MKTAGEGYIKTWDDALQQEVWRAPSTASFAAEDAPDPTTTETIIAYLTTGSLRGLVYTNGREWILIQRQLSVKDFGAIGDGASHLITEDEIAAHVEFIGSYEADVDEWDYVGINECHLAAFAAASLPWAEYLAANPGADPGDNIVWNGSAAPGIFSNAGVYYPEGQYLCNKTVVARGVSGFEIRGAGKRVAAIHLTTDDKPLFLYDGLSYGSIHSLSCFFSGSHNYGHALMEIDWTGVFSSLRPQQLFMPNLHFQGTKEADYGLRFSKTGGGSQGDTIYCPSFSGFVFRREAIILGNDDPVTLAQNALAIQFDNGNIQQCARRGVLVVGGQVFIDGMSFQCQVLDDDYLNSPVFHNGGDVVQYGSGGRSGLSTIRNIRSESSILADGITRVYDSAAVGADTIPWSAAGYYAVGRTVYGAVGVGEKGDGRRYVCVDASATEWVEPDEDSDLSNIIFPGASFTTDEWVGWGLEMRFPNGFKVVRLVDSNDADTVTLTAPLPFDYHNIDGSVCGFAQAFDCIAVRFVGLTSGTEPEWHDVPAGVNNLSFPNASMTAGSNILHNPGPAMGAGHIGWYVIVQGAGEGGRALVSQIVDVIDADEVELADEAVSDTADSAEWNPGVRVFMGEPVTDGDAKWIHLEYDAVRGAEVVQESSFEWGRLGGAVTTLAVHNKFSREDWIDPAQFAALAPGDFQYIAAQELNHVGAGSINQANIPYRLFGNPTAPKAKLHVNYPGAHFGFDAGGDNVTFKHVGFGRGDGKGYQSGEDHEAEQRTRNTFAFWGTLSRAIPRNDDGSLPEDADGERVDIMGGPSTGAGVPGPVSFWMQKPGEAGNDVPDAELSAEIDHTGLLVNDGVRQGTGVKHKRVTTGSVAASSTADVTVTWDGAEFADNKYTLSLAIEDSTGSLTVIAVLTRTATNCTVRVKNSDAGGAHTGTLHVRATHDPWEPPPIALTGLQVVLNQDGLSATDPDGTAISTWSDGSGNSRDAAQATSGKRPVLATRNGHRCVYFDGTDDSLATANLAAVFASAATAFIVYEEDGSIDNYSILDPASGDNWWSFSRQGYTALWRNPRVDTYPTSMPTGGPHLLTSRSSASGYEIWLDGVSQGAQSAAYAAGGIVTLGCANNPTTSGDGRYFKGWVYVVEITNVANDTVDINTRNTELKTEFGIA